MDTLIRGNSKLMKNNAASMLQQNSQFNNNKVATLQHLILVYCCYFSGICTISLINKPTQKLQIVQISISLEFAERSLVQLYLKSRGGDITAQKMKLSINDFLSVNVTKSAVSCRFCHIY